jgi:hypothetical protein
MAQLSDLRKQRDTARQQARHSQHNCEPHARRWTPRSGKGQTSQANAQTQIIATLTAQRNNALKRAQSATQQLDACARPRCLRALADPPGAIDASSADRPASRPSRNALPRRDAPIRVYPDDIHIDLHEPALTADEFRRGRDFWQQLAAGTEQQDAWAELARFRGLERAEDRQADPGRREPARARLILTRPARAVLLSRPMMAIASSRPRGDRRRLPNPGSIDRGPVTR